MSNATLIIKVETLYGIIDELNYYQILRLQQDCIQAEIASAYKIQANFYHPKQFEDESSELIDQIQYIALSIKEAYQSIKHIEGRLSYDARLENNLLRINDTKLTRGLEKQKSNDPRKAATNEKAKKYWLMGLQAFEAKEFDNAIMQIQFALQFEPTNDTFIEWLEKSKEAAKKAPKKNKNPYKLRL